MRAILRICDFLFVLRPVILIPAWSFYLIGASEGAQPSPGPRSLVPSPLAAFSLTAILVTAYLLNQIFDRESDERNNKCLFLSRGIFSVRALVLMAVASLLVASYAYHHLGDPQRAPLIVALALAFAYSLPPVRLCSRPVFDLLANAVGYGGIAFALGFGVFDPSRGSAAWSSLPYVLLVGSTFLHTTILDLAGDRASGKTSTTVLMGIRGSTIAAAALGVGAFSCALATGSLTAVIVTGVSLPIVLYPALKKSGGSSVFVIQANTLIVALAAAVFWPAYLALVVPLVALSRFYHRRRFGITYPGPTGIVSKRA